MPRLQFTNNDTNIVPALDTAEYYQDQHLRYEDYVYLPNVKTVLIHQLGSPLSAPYIKLNNNEQLHLSFDILDGDPMDLGYTIIHCDANWQPSDLLPDQYMSQLTEGFINDFMPSRVTLQQYIHYNLVFPNDQMELSKSGNYVIKVYDAANPDQVLLTRRFMVTEQLIGIVARLQPASNVDYRFSHQEVDFKLISPKYQLTNPYTDLKVVVRQNGRWDNAITNLQPVFAKADELDYDYNGENRFMAGMEYRYFDIKNLLYQEARTDKSGYFKGKNHVFLVREAKRTYMIYQSWQDINGKQFIKVESQPDSEVDADYVWVHFRLAYHEELVNGNLYIMGQLVDWQFSKESQMIYNKEKRQYEGALYLKQGYHNYEYVFLEDGKNIGNSQIIEGSHEKTENDYWIYVYHRSLGDDFDRIVGLQKFNYRTD